MLRFGREAAVRPQGSNQLGRRHPREGAEIAIEMRLIVIAALERDGAETP